MGGDYQVGLRFEYVVTVFGDDCSHLVVYQFRLGASGLHECQMFWLGVDDDDGVNYIEWYCLAWLVHKQMSLIAGRLRVNCSSIMLTLTKALLIMLNDRLYTTLN